MRLDKYLKLSRIFKRRIIAKEGQYAQGAYKRPNRETKQRRFSERSDTTIIYQNKEVTIKVLELATKESKDKAASLYEIVSEKSK